MTDDVSAQPSLFDGAVDRDEAAGTARPRFPVRVVRSARRRRTVHAQLVDGEIVVRIPERMSKKDEAEYVAELVARIEKREQRGAIDLDARTRELARRYDLPLPAAIRFVDNQRSRWGSCTIESGEIRVSSKLADYPAWVLDYVIVHELAHLVVADHSAEFHAIVDRFPRAERARGYLLAKADGM
jgi:predicted metal-dependent hydrolase